MTFQVGKEPMFLSREEIDRLHQRSIERYGGDPGLLSDHLIESALVAPQNVYHYKEQADHIDIASAYAFHIAENQAYADGNKRTAVAAATAYLELNGIDASRLPEQQTYEAMIDVAEKRMDREALGHLVRSSLQPEREQEINQQEPERQETYAEELRRKARERGQELRDIVPMPEQELDQDQDLEL